MTMEQRLEAYGVVPVVVLKKQRTQFLLQMHFVKADFPAQK